MKRFAVTYLSTMIFLLPLDFLFLSTIGKKLFYDRLGDILLTTPRLPAAVLFYLLYLAGVVVFVNGSAPVNWLHNLAYGALFGLFCYATFELTNMSLMRGWSWAIVGLDVTWGVVLTAISAAAGGMVANWVLVRL
jgi:uncharacterized membrane protein